MASLHRLNVRQVVSLPQVEVNTQESRDVWICTVVEPLSLTGVFIQCSPGSAGESLSSFLCG